MKSQAWTVRRKGRLLDTVWFDADMTAEDVKRILCNHDGYAPDIKISKKKDKVKIMGKYKKACYLETFYRIATALTLHIMSGHDCIDFAEQINIVESLADKFEAKYANKAWDGDWEETISRFIEENLKDRIHGTR